LGREARTAGIPSMDFFPLENEFGNVKDWVQRESKNGVNPL
jgi:hypothetical protein